MKQKLLEVLNDYGLREFNEILYERVEDIPPIIPIAYTTTENGKHEVNVYFDIETFRWLNFVDGDLKLVTKLNSLEDFIEDMEYADFDCMIFDILCIAEEMDV